MYVVINLFFFLFGGRGESYLLCAYTCTSTCIQIVLNYPFLQLKDLLSEVEFVMVPVANPDGYYMSWLHTCVEKWDS